MAVYEALLLNTVVPQIQAAQAGDSYVMVVNATTPALRITQTGTGNAISVEDEANPDSSPFVVTSAGDVGIGSSSPAYKLQVVGTAGVLGEITAGYNGGNNGITFSQDWRIRRENATTGNLWIENSGSAVAVFTASGNLGLGVTPSAKLEIYSTNNAFNALQVRYNGSNDAMGFGIANSNGFPYLGYNTKSQASVDAPVYERSNPAAQLRMDSGSFKFNIAASGTAGNTISFTQAMTLNTSGNLLVGVTSASYSSAGRGVTILGGSASGLLGFQIGGVAKGYVAHFDSNMQIWNDTNSPMLFATNSTERGQFSADGTFRVKGAGTAGSTDAFQVSGSAPADAARITSGGNLLVGTTSLYNSNSNTGTYSWSAATGSGGEGAFVFVNTSTSTNSDPNPVLILYKSSTTTSSAQRFIQFYADGVTQPMGGIVGNGATNVQFISLSDAREKENVSPVTGALNRVMQLEVVSFDRKGGGDHVKAGFLAQNVLPIYPEYVVENFADAGQDKRYGITGGMSAGYVAELTAALQELKSELDSVKAELAALKGA